MKYKVLEMYFEDRPSTYWPMWSENTLFKKWKMFIRPILVHYKATASCYVTGEDEFVAYDNISDALFFIEQYKSNVELWGLHPERYEIINHPA